MDASLAYSFFNRPQSITSWATTSIFQCRRATLKAQPTDSKAAYRILAAVQDCYGPGHAKPNIVAARALGESHPGRLQRDVDVLIALPVGVVIAHSV